MLGRNRNNKYKHRLLLNKNVISDSLKEDFACLLSVESLSQPETWDIKYSRDRRVSKDIRYRPHPTPPNLVKGMHMTVDGKTLKVKLLPRGYQAVGLLDQFVSRVSLHLSINSFLFHNASHPP